MAKKKLALKVAEETGVEVADLERLPVEALNKLDALTPDSDDLLGGNVAEVSSKVLLGYHPITGKEIWN